MRPTDRQPQGLWEFRAIGHNQERCRLRVSYGLREVVEGTRGFEDHGPIPHIVAGAGQGLPVVGCWGPPAVRATFNGSPEKVALFIGQVLNNMDRYGHLYTSQRDQVMAITAVMEEKVVDWVADLYGEHTEELGDLSLFLAALQERFEDTTSSQQAEGELLAVRQRGRPVKEYI